jgi:hypothetical protein
MDYKELLIKYIGHIIDCEGKDYTYIFHNPGHTVEFSDEEMAALVQLSEEAKNRFQ